MTRPPQFRITPGLAFSSGLSLPRLRLGCSSVVWRAGNPFPSLRTVDIERTPSGVIVVAWRAEPEPQRHQDMGSILCATSRDEGRNWSSPLVIAHSDQEVAYGNVTLFAYEGGLHAFIGCCPAGHANSEKQRIVSRISTDDGSTWSDGGLEVDYFHPTIGGGKVLRFAGRFLMPFHRNDSLRLHGVLVSEDLRSWRLGGVVPQTGGSELREASIFLQEGFLAPANDHSGELLLVMREGDWRVSGQGEAQQWTLVSAGHCAHVSRTRDGLNWSPAEPWPDIPNYNVKGMFLTDSLERYVILYNDSADRSRLLAMAGAPGAWSPPLLLAESGEWNCYPMAVEVGPRADNETRILAAYEAGKRDVVFQEFFVTGSLSDHTPRLRHASPLA